LARSQPVGAVRAVGAETHGVSIKRLMFELRGEPADLLTGQDIERLDPVFFQHCDAAAVGAEMTIWPTLAVIFHDGAGLGVVDTSFIVFSKKPLSLRREQK